MCVCVCEREREGEKECVYVSLCVCMCMCVTMCHLLCASKKVLIFLLISIQALHACVSVHEVCEEDWGWRDHNRGQPGGGKVNRRTG